MIHYLMVSHGENRTWDPSQFHGEREAERVSEKNIPAHRKDSSS